MDKESIMELIKKVFAWGIGAVLMIIGALVMVFHKKLDIGFPEYLFVGFGLVLIGAIIYIVVYILAHKERMFINNSKMALVASPDEHFEKNIEKYNKIFKKHVNEKE